MAAECGINPELFRRMAKAYHRGWGIGLCAASPDGKVALAFHAKAWTGGLHQDGRRLAIHEALRWGEPVVELSANEGLIWGVPLSTTPRCWAGWLRV